MKNWRLIIFIVAFLVLSGLSSVKLYISYFGTYKAAEVTLAKQYLSIAQEISSGIDMRMYKRIYEDRIKNEDFFLMQEYLDHYRTRINALFVYTLTFDDTPISKILTYATPEGMDVPIGYACIVPEKQVNEMKKGQPYYTKILLDESFGQYLSVGVPIIDEAGNVLGAVGIDISVESLNQIGNEVNKRNSIFLAIDVIFVFLILLVLYFIRLWYVRRLNKEMKDTEHIYIEELRRLIDSFKTTRHDFGNHLQVLSGLLEYDQHKEANEYLKVLLEKNKILDLSVKIKHPALMVLFNSKWELANSKDIQMRFDIDLNEYNQIKSVDLVKILSNLIDNSIEACEVLPQNSRLIVVTCKNIGNKYIFAIENNAQISTQEAKQLFSYKYSTKNTNDSNSRGDGLGIVQSVVKKYKGEIYHHYKSGKLLIQIILRVDKHDK